MGNNLDSITFPIRLGNHEFSRLRVGEVLSSSSAFRNHNGESRSRFDWFWNPVKLHNVLTHSLDCSHAGRAAKRVDVKRDAQGGVHGEYELLIPLPPVLDDSNVDWSTCGRSRHNETRNNSLDTSSPSTGNSTLPQS